MCSPSEFQSSSRGFSIWFKTENSQCTRHICNLNIIIRKHIAETFGSFVTFEVSDQMLIINLLKSEHDLLFLKFLKMTYKSEHQFTNLNNMKITFLK